MLVLHTSILLEVLRLLVELATNELRKLKYGKSRAKEHILFCGDKEMTKRMSGLGKVKIIKNTGHKFTRAYKKATLKVI